MVDELLLASFYIDDKCGSSGYKKQNSEAESGVFVHAHGDAGSVEGGSMLKVV